MQVPSISYLSFEVHTYMYIYKHFVIWESEGAEVWPFEAMDSTKCRVHWDKCVLTLRVFNIAQSAIYGSQPTKYIPLEFIGTNGHINYYMYMKR